jgi:hypothetical protein
MIRATMSGGMFVDPSFNWLTRDRTRLHRIWKDWLTTWLRSSEVRTIQSSLDAAEFWLCVGEHDKLRLTLTPYLGKIVPVLLESMVYSEEDVLRLERGVSMKTKKTGRGPETPIREVEECRTNITSNGDDHQQLHTVVNGTNTSKRAMRLKHMMTMSLARARSMNMKMTKRRRSGGWLESPKMFGRRFGRSCLGLP